MLEDGDPEPAPKQRRKKGTISTQNNFSPELRMDEILDIKGEQKETSVERRAAYLERGWGQRLGV